MRLLVGGGDGATRVVELSVDRPGATIADLAEALGFDRMTALVVDGLPCDVRASIADIPFVDGCSVHPLGATPTSARSEAGYFWLGITNGPGTGLVHRTTAGTTVSFGRDPSNDLVIDNSSVSARHGQLIIDDRGQVFVDDHASRNGTWIDGYPVDGRTPVYAEARIRVGSSTIRVCEIDPRARSLGAATHHADATGHIRWNRSPREPVAAEPAQVVVPNAAPVRESPKLAIAAVVAPLLFAGVMVVVLGSWRYALFGLLSPVMAIANWLTSRRQLTRASRRDRAAMTLALRDLETALADAESTERARRRAFAPDIIEVRRRIEQPGRELWERRPHSRDAFAVRIGIGECPFDVSVVEAEDGAPGAEDLVEAARRLDDAEIVVDLSAGNVGLVGGDRQRTALLRSIVTQLATHHGPADLEIGVVTSPERRHLWAWTRWLPHVRHIDPTSTSSAAEATPSHLVLVIDDASAVLERSSPVRRHLSTSERVFAVVSADSTDDLPAFVSSLVEVEGEDGNLVLRELVDRSRECRGIADLVDLSHARDLARSMARFADPELDDLEGELPSRVAIADLWGALPDANTIAAQWDNAGPGIEGLEFTIGIGAHGPVELDLVADGPHVLVAGTTGSGKSEFLRSMIVGLALAHSPKQVGFVLLDYKGGSAFDACEDLPHVVGVVTDLDDQLAERALVSLEAELRLRERWLRTVGASDIVDYQRAGSPNGELARLVVVVDEFATLRAELPNFVDGLVSIAQRGRSLGLHLVLATQRPSGVVDAHIRANTNLRVALRVTAASDSVDVIDSPVAANIGRSAPGRAYVRRGGSEVECVQTAFVSGVAHAAGAPLRVRRVDIGSAPEEPNRDGGAVTGTSDLTRMAAEVCAAFGDGERPRRPWLAALPARVTVDDIDDEPNDPEEIVVALGDRPAEQARTSCRWRPRSGHLGVVGIRGSGVSSTIRHVVAALGSARRKETWIFAVDHGGGGLEGISAWPHVACVLDPTEIGRLRRLLAIIAAELDDREGRPAASIDAFTELILAIDGVGGFFEAVRLDLGASAIELLERVVRDGPALGITLLVGATRHRDVPRGLRDHLAQVVALEMPDRGDYAAVGIHVRHAPAFVPGRALWGPDGTVAQVIDWESTFDPADAATSMPPAVDELPAVIDLQQLALAEFGDGLSVPFGFEVATHSPAVLHLQRGEHATIAGPPASGKTNALCVVAEQLRLADERAVLLGLAPADADAASELGASAALDAFGTLEETEHIIRMALDDARRWVVLVDDAHRIDDASGLLDELVRSARRQLHVVIALRSATTRAAHGHWSRSVRTSGKGLLLQPDARVDGELLGARLPFEGVPSMAAGRGYLVHGADARPVQVARVVPSGSQGA